MKVISGKDNGKTAQVLRALPRENKVVIDGVALYKRHLKGAAGKVGRIVERPRAIDASNVALVVSRLVGLTVSRQAAKRED